MGPRCKARWFVREFRIGEPNSEARAAASAFAKFREIWYPRARVKQ
jgi:hypothetical protein